MYQYTESTVGQSGHETLYQRQVQEKIWSSLGKRVRNRSKLRLGTPGPHGGLAAFIWGGR